MTLGFKRSVLTTILAGLVAPTAWAQSGDNPFSRGRHVAVTERPQPGFDPEAVRAGGFQIWSRLGVFAEYNDNIFAEEDNEDDDTIIRVRPTIDARSDWSSHELNAGLSIDHNEYIANGSETTTNYNAFAGGRIDVQRAFNLRGRLDAAHITEPRYEPGSATSPDPVQYDRLGARVGASYRRDRFQLEGDVGQTEDDFEGAANSFRDVTESYVHGRASYAVSPDVAFFVQARSADLDYDPPAPGNPNRDGTRSSIQIGANFDLQAPFSGEISIGQEQDEKDDPLQPDTDGLNFTGRLQWYPTELTTVTFRGFRGIVDPGIPDVASATSTTWGARVDHELMRNVILFGDFGFAKYEFEDYDREDERFDVSIGAAYKLNRNMRVDVSYRSHRVDSSGAFADRNLDQNILSAGLTIFP